jgi:hypothetical protein
MLYDGRVKMEFCKWAGAGPTAQKRLTREELLKPIRDAFVSKPRSGSP